MRKMNLLIVDDETHAREAVKLLVPWEELGITRILEADNGEAAKLLVSQYLPVLALTDVTCRSRTDCDLWSGSAAAIPDEDHRHQRLQ